MKEEKKNMKAFHNTRQDVYRRPFGAVTAGKEVYLAIDVWDAPGAQGTLRIWIDGEGEKLLPMERETMGDAVRLSVTFTQNEPAIVWYSFIISDGGQELRYGAEEGRTGGIGRLYSWEPPSFQITVSRERKVPDWYKKGIVYQIFPDRFRRGDDWRRNAARASRLHKNGPRRVYLDDWFSSPAYRKDSSGRVVEWGFFGGTLRGIEDKLDYLSGLGVTVLYLNPVFEAASNHRYDTADYYRIDPMLGTEEDFKDLCIAAEERGISIILDGVFNHTGCDSVYFNKYRNYPEPGAYQREGSPYDGWYKFYRDSNEYESWWGVGDLPEVDESSQSYRDFIFGCKDSVVRKWLRDGAKGWRLDVADEMPDDFIAGIKSSVVTEKPEDGLLIGEVWEDASNKISYSKLRRYFLGDELDSVMNYPFRDGLLQFLRGEIRAQDLTEKLMSLYENYPHEAFYSALNLLGSHDRARLLTVLGGAPDEGNLTESERAGYRLSSEQWYAGIARMWLAVLIQMTMPGVPCIYYGDEAGMEGYSDPFNRGPFPWGNVNEAIYSMYESAISIRKMSPVFTDGSFTPFSVNDDVFGICRGSDSEKAIVLVNRSVTERYDVELPAFGECAYELVSGTPVIIESGLAMVTLGPKKSAVIRFCPEKRLGAPMERGSGVLCHVTSVPCDMGPGVMGGPCRRFIDYLAESGQKYWQILPLNPTDSNGSPYAGTSAFAGNVNLINTGGRELRDIYGEFIPDDDYFSFCRENGPWLDPYAVFCAIKEIEDNRPWQEWPGKYRTYSPELETDPDISSRTGFYRFCQFLFTRQWDSVRNYANGRGIKIIGDMPMYVSGDSADVWAYPEYFALNAGGWTELEAGVPPDYFSADGQMWGNPVYRWDVMKEDGYAWWMERFRRIFGLCDYARLDHFRGFESYWAVPVGEPATSGKWYPGPGIGLFRTAYDTFGPLPILAEDLGVITPAVRELVAECGFPGTDVMQFGDADPLMEFESSKNRVAYTGTHDNQTLLGWCSGRYPFREPEKMTRRLLEQLFSCSAGVVITPLQDILGLDDSARMNVPGTVGENWRWQADERDFGGSSERLLNLTINSNRR